MNTARYRHKECPEPGTPWPIRRLLTAALVALAALVSGAFPALADDDFVSHGHARLIADQTVVTPGETLHAALVIDVDDGWHIVEPWSVERVAELQSEGRPILVDFTARWCMTCQVNARLALDTPDVQKALAETNAVMLVADWPQKNDDISVELARHGRAGVPLYLVYPGDARQAPVVLPQTLTSSLVRARLHEAASTLSERR